MLNFLVLWNFFENGMTTLYLELSIKKYSHFIHFHNLWVMSYDYVLYRSLNDSYPVPV